MDLDGFSIFLGVMGLALVLIVFEAGWEFGHWNGVRSVIHQLQIAGHGEAAMWLATEYPEQAK